MITPSRVRLYLDKPHLLHRVVTIGISPASIAWQVMGYDGEDVVLRNVQTDLVSRTVWVAFKRDMKQGTLVYLDTRQKWIRARLTPATVPSKECRRCHKHGTNFGRLRTSPDGFQEVCRACRVIEQTQGRARRRARLSVVGRVA